MPVILDNKLAIQPFHSKLDSYWLDPPLLDRFQQTMLNKLYLYVFLVLYEVIWCYLQFHRSNRCLPIWKWEWLPWSWLWNRIGFESMGGARRMSRESSSWLFVVVRHSGIEVLWCWIGLDKCLTLIQQKFCQSKNPLNWRTIQTLCSSCLYFQPLPGMYVWITTISLMARLLNSSFCNWRVT